MSDTVFLKIKNVSYKLCRSNLQESIVETQNNTPIPRLWEYPQKMQNVLQNK